MIYLGISAFYHDSAAAIIKDGVIIAAAQEERFSRKKHDSRFPINAIKYCLDECGLSLEEINYIVYYEKPFIKFERLLETYLATIPFGIRSFNQAIPVWLKEKLFQKNTLKKNFALLGDVKNIEDKFLFSEHHLSHAASAFYPSPFEKAVVLTMDGVGEWATTSVGIGNGRDLEIIKEVKFPHSIGLLYSAFTYYTGFKVNSGEYKVMGLAPYGEPKYVDLILENLVDLKEDGSFRLDQSYFNYMTGLTMTNQKFADLFGGPPRQKESEITQKEMDLAASVQKVIEIILMRLTESLAKEYEIENLCLAGGVALNCVANGKVLRSGVFKNIWIQPAAGDAGGAVGCALSAYYLHGDNERVVSKERDGMKGSYLGPEYEQSEIDKQLTEVGAKFHKVSEDEMIERTSSFLANGKAIGWMQGRMEFGPRALGGRSIIADARSQSMQKILNLKVKYRESFRPFAPSVLREDVEEWFELKEDSPYMLLVAEVAKEKQIPMTDEQKNLFGIQKLNIPRSQIPAVTHVDYSARVQTVHRDTNPKYHKLISKFKEKTGCPVVVNTSFNVRGEPIVCDPQDAFKCFMGTELDVLVIGNNILLKEEQNSELKINYEEAFELD